MIRRIVKIDRNACTGCGLCIDACHEGAIALDAEGKACLLRDDYCDGLGDCLPACPANAISFETREALPYDEEAVEANMRVKETPPASGCSGSHVQVLREMTPVGSSMNRHVLPSTPSMGQPDSELRQWPVQIKLVPVNAPYFRNADVLIAADCSAFAYGNFHEEFMRGRVTLVGCPKLDGVDYSEKLAAIFRENDVKSVTLARMSVPCCGGLLHAVRQALETSGKNIPFHVAVITPEGRIAPNL